MKKLLIALCALALSTACYAGVGVGVDPAARGLAATAQSKANGSLQKANNLSDVASLNTTMLNLQAGYVLCQGATATPHTGDTNEFTEVTCTVPANAMDANGQIIVEGTWSNTNSANLKTYRIRFGGTATVNTTSTTTIQNVFRTRIANRNATNSQITQSSPAGFGGNSNALVTAAIDTTASTTVTFSCQLATSTETCQLESWQVVLYPHS